VKIEDLDKVLIHKNIKNVEKFPYGEELFKRVRKFKIFGLEYKIKWWNNQCYLTHFGVTVLFDTVEQSGTWPNNMKLNLQFCTNDDICAIVGIEYYPD